jgi:hypothetical protein
MEAKRKNKLTKEEMTGRIEALAQKRRTKEVIQLPICFDDKRATPNSFIRSALFSAVQAKDRVFLNGIDIESQDGITVNFKGEQLNQDDLTLWMALIHLTKGKPLGSAVTLSAHSILKAMDLSTGGDQHKQLHEGIRRLNGGSVQITHLKKKYIGTLIKEAFQDEETGHYAIVLNPNLIQLFGDTQWTAVDWQQRLVLRRKPLAQALHAYFSSHKNPFPVTLEFLRKLTGSRNTQPASFKRQCRVALENLVAIGFLQDFGFQGNNVIVQRAMQQLEAG